MSLLAWLGVASGVTLALTGIAVLAARPRRQGSLFFALFTIAWSLDILLFNAFDLAGNLATEQLLAGAALAFTLVEVLFLIYFVVRFTDTQDTRHVWWAYGAAAYAAVVGGLLALNPGLFVSGRFLTVETSWLVSVPKFAAFYIALHVLVVAYLSETRETVRRESAIVVTALALYASYTAGFFATFYGLEWLVVGDLDPLSDLPFVILFGAAVLLLAYQTVLVLRRSSPETRSGLDRWVVAGLTLPLLLGVATGAPSRLTDTRVDLFGVLRIVAGLLIAYGLVKFEIFDIDLKVKEGLRRAAIVSVFVLTFVAASETVEFLVSDRFGTWAGLAAAGALALGFRPIEQQASRLTERAMPGVADSQIYRDERKLEVYQAAVERAAHDEVLTEREKEILSGLRDELSLREAQAREIEQRILSRPVVA